MTDGTASTSEQLVDLRRANSARCAEAIRQSGAMTIAEIARAAELSRPTVTARLQDLLSAGLVAEVPAKSSRAAGRPASRFRFVADAGTVAGLELGKHVERLVLADLLGRELWQGERAVVIDGADERLADAAAWVRSTAEQLGRPLVRVGVAFPGAMDPSGVLVEAAAFTEWLGLNVAPLVGAAWSVPVDVRHDVAAAMLAEQRMGAASDVATFVVPVLWHRVSAGLVVSGRVHPGHTGRAGLLSRTAALVDDDTFDQEWPSAPAVSALAKAATAGDAAAAASLDRFGAIAARQIAMLQLVIDPEIIVLHGPLTVHDALVERVRGHLARELPTAAPVVVSEFGQSGAVIGALLTALDGAAEALIGPGMAPHVLDRTRSTPAIGGLGTDVG